MIDKYDDLARRTGARIVSFCGHDCVPWDLAGKTMWIISMVFIIWYVVLECAKQLKKKGETISEVRSLQM